MIHQELTAVEQRPEDVAAGSSAAVVPFSRLDMRGERRLLVRVWRTAER